MMAHETKEKMARMSSTTLATGPVCRRRSPTPPEKAVVWRRRKTAAEDTHTSLDWADERSCHNRLGLSIINRVADSIRTPLGTVWSYPLALHRVRAVW